MASSPQKMVEKGFRLNINNIGYKIKCKTRRKISVFLEIITTFAKFFFEHIPIFKQ
jgi:hypothetical protein